MFEKPLKENVHRIDWVLWGGILGLMLVGALFIFSASRAGDPTSGLWMRQVISYGIGIMLVAVLCGVDYTKWSRYALVGYWGCILLLLAVLIPGVGVMRYGARRWIDFGPVQFQPSEFAKLGFIFMQAHYLSQPVEELRRRSAFLKSLALAALPFVLILKEPDLGSALVFFPVGLAMMFVAGVPRQTLAKFLGGSAVIIGLLLLNVLFAPPQWQVKIEDYQRHRLLVFFGLDFAPRDATPEARQKARSLQREKSYNVEQALISVGSGGVMGKGWREGTQNALGYLPRAVAHNDFIFSVIAEEKGFVGSVIVITLYTIVLLSGLRIAGQARDRLGKLLAVGVVALLFSHIFINIGMNIRLMPVTGIPLPLLSYGGSSVVCSLIAIGILQNVHLYRRSY
ncbi:MAG TPA: rod shape-determining protein RodA [Methylomirabilota bacterium]|nr:rod shape-determining protein RodA [Methylomirabilota bacterium]